MLLRPGALALLLAGLPLSAVEAQIEKISLSSSGLAEAVRRIDVAVAPSGIGTAKLKVHEKDLDDILKSLIVSGEGLKSATLRMDSSEAFSDTFSDLPFSADDLKSLDSLLARLVGEQVVIGDLDVLEGEVIRAKSGLTGQIVGVSNPDVCDASQDCRAELLLLVHGKILRHVKLDEGVQVSFVSDDRNTDISRAIQALARSLNVNQSEVLIELHPQEGHQLPKDILVSTVTAAPLWKTSYRIVIDDSGEAKLQAWAVLENAGIDDWEDIDLTLTASTQKSLHQDLWARQSGTRQDVNTSPQAKGQAQFAMESLAARSFGADTVSAAPMAAMAPETTLLESEVDARFTFPDPVSLGSGELISLPFLQDGLEASRVAWFQGGAGKSHPEFTLDIRNSLPVRLPGGIMSIQEGSLGYIGDAYLPDLPVGESRMVPYAADKGTQIQERNSSHRIDGRLRMVSGVAVIEDYEVMDTHYQIAAPAEQSRTILIDHPERPGWDVETLSEDVKTKETLEGSRQVRRMTLDLEGGEKKKVHLRSKRKLQTRVQVFDAPMVQIIDWTAREMDPKDRDLINDILEKRQDIDDTELRIERLSEERLDLIEEQSRYVEIFKTKDAELSQRYRSRIMDIDDKIAAVDAEMDEARATLDAAKADLRNLIGG